MNVVIFYDLKRLEEIGVSEQYILNFRDDVNYNFIANPCCRLPTYVFNLEELQKSKNSLSEILFLVCIFVLVYVSNEFDIFSTRTQDVRKENARREVFEQSQNYIDGKNQELSKLYYDWRKSKPEDKTIIENLVRSDFENFSTRNVKNEDVKTFC